MLLVYNSCKAVNFEITNSDDKGRVENHTLKGVGVNKYIPKNMKVVALRHMEMLDPFDMIITPDFFLES